jgi:hypothetical protein
LTQIGISARNRSFVSEQSELILATQKCKKSPKNGSFPHRFAGFASALVILPLLTHLTLMQPWSMIANPYCGESLERKTFWAYRKEQGFPI